MLPKRATASDRPPPSEPAPRDTRPSGSHLLGTRRLGTQGEIFYSDAGCALGRYEHVQICVWRKAPTVHALEVVQRTGEALSAANPGGIGIMGVAEEGMPIMGSEERRMSIKMLSETAAHVAFYGCVIEGDGFWASAARSTMTAICLVARPSYPFRIFRYPGDASTWQSRFPTGVSPIGLTDTVERLRAQMGPR